MGTTKQKYPLILKPIQLEFLILEQQKKPFRRKAPFKLEEMLETYISNIVRLWLPIRRILSTLPRMPGSRPVCVYCHIM